MDEKIKLKDVKIRKLILVSIVMMVLTIIIGVCLGMYAELTGKSFDTAIMGAELIVRTLFLIVIWRMIIPKKSKILKAIKGVKKEISIKEIFSIVFINIGLSIGVSSIFLAVLIFVDINGANAAINEQIMPVASKIDYFIFVILGVLIAPVLEEFIYRGILFRRLGKRFGLWAGIIVSSIIFGSRHITLSSIGAMIFGITSCILYMKYKNILVPMLVHFINNSLAFGLEILGGIDIEEMNEVVTLTISDGIGELLIGVVVLTVSVFFFVRFIKKNKQYVSKGVEIA